MKTKFKKLAMLVAFAAVLTSCSSNDKSYEKEDFLDGYLIASGFNASSTNFINSGSYEFGLEFTPLVTGKITTLKVKLPDVNSALKITIWDKAAGTPLKTETVNYATANILTVFDVEDLALIKDKQYAITFNSNDWYKRNKADSSNATYPMTVGNIKIDAYKWVSGSTQTYPTNISNNYYAGDLTFDFQQTQ